MKDVNEPKNLEIAARTMSSRAKRRYLAYLSGDRHRTPWVLAMIEEAPF
jgi:hypothetical protein